MALGTSIIFTPEIFLIIIVAKQTKDMIYYFSPLMSDMHSDKKNKKHVYKVEHVWYIKKVAFERWTSSLKTEQNTKRQCFI
jgi:hypothetical protein